MLRQTRRNLLHPNQRERVMEASAIVFSGVNRIERRSFRPRELAEGEVLIETAYTCISPGTELRLLRGGRDQPYPAIPGYAIAGRVIQSRSEVPEGARRFCTGSIDTAISANGGGQVSHAIAPAAVTTPIPDEVDLLEATTCILAAIALRGVRLSRPRLGEVAALVGLGVIGQFSARLHALAGARVIGCDRAPFRVDKLAASGIEALVLGDDLASTFAPRIGAGVELIIDATGAPAVLPQALKLARLVPLTDAPQPDNRYLVQGSYAGDVTFPYLDAFRRQITFLIPKAHQPQDRVAALELYRRGELAGRDLITEVRTPEEAERTYRELQDPANPYMTMAFAWNPAIE